MSIELGVVLTMLSGVLGYVAFSRNKKNDDTGTGITLGTIMTKLDFMSGNILDIKTDIRELNHRQDKIDDRVGTLEKEVAIIKSTIDSTKTITRGNQ